VTITSHGDFRARWQRRGGRVEIPGIFDPAITARPAGWPGDLAAEVVESGSYVLFRDAPTLDDMRAILPEYAPLWDAVAADASAAP
jgi:hypothetical protein